MGHWRRAAVFAGVSLGLGCGGGSGPSGDPPPPPPTYTIGGTVSGLTGSGLVLVRDGTTELAISAGATSFTFPGSVGAGSGYSVTLKVQPTGPSESCTVANGSGNVGSTNVTAIAVTCTVNSFAVGGTIAGLVGTGLTLQLNGGAPQAIAPGTAAFSFPNVASGANYTVTIGAQPASPVQTCTVANATGTVASGAVANIAVTCLTTTYTIGGAIVGLSGPGLVLQNNNGNDLAVAAAATSFTFTNPLTPGSAYTVSVKARPTSPAQTCTVANAAGTASANVTSVVVTCATNSTGVGGTISGLVGTGLSLLLNGASVLSPAPGATSFTFAGKVAPGSTYAVTVAAHPTGPGQTCTIANATGTAGATDITNVAVTCANNPANTWTVGGPITGLTAAGLVLKRNGSTTLTVAAGATTYAFPAVASGTPYTVTVGTQPANQVCTVSNPSGTVGAANVINVGVNCTVATYTIGGPVTGLTGFGLKVQLNGGTPMLVPSGSTAFTFPGGFTSGTAYTVTVSTQPTSPSQICSITNGTGAIGSANVTNVAITCALGYTVGGTIGPNILYSNGLVLLLNGASPITRGVDQPNFTFPALPPGTPYTVTVGTQPAAPSHTCTVTNGSGIVGTAHVTNVNVDCVPNGMIVVGILQGYSGTGLALKATFVRAGTLLPASGVALTPQSQGKYAFPDIFNPDDEYSIVIAAQPAGQTCTIAQATGRVWTLAQSINGFTVPSGKIKCVNNTTSPLSGVYSVLTTTGRAYVGFWPDGTFTVAARSDVPSCPDNGNGIEEGVYNWNAGTGAFAVVSVAVDTDGGCGLVDPNAPFGAATLTKSGSALTLVTSEGTFNLTQVASNPGTLVGAFGYELGQNGVFAVFQADNTYIIASPQGAGSHGLGTKPGYERACYTASATTITANLGTSCLPDGFPVVDTDGPSGFSTAGGPVPYLVPGPNTLTIDNVKLIRLLP